MLSFVNVLVLILFVMKNVFVKIKIDCVVIFKIFNRIFL